MVLAIACVGWWIGIPVLTLWGLAHATDDGTTHFVTGLVGVPIAMAVTAPVLLWLNGLYLRVTGVYARVEEDEEEGDWAGACAARSSRCCSSRSPSPSSPSASGSSSSRTRRRDRFSELIGAASASC